MLDIERKNLTTIFEAILDGVYIVDDDFNMEYMNNVMIKNFGRGIGKKCYQIIYGRDAVCSWCKAKGVFAGKTIRWEHYIPNLDQVYDFIEFPLKNSDGTLSKVGIYRDIALRAKSEEKIRASEKEYKRLFENVRCGIYVSTKEGKFLNVNKALLDMLAMITMRNFLISISLKIFTSTQRIVKNGRR